MVPALFRFVALGLIFAPATFAETNTDAENAQQSIVYIYFDVVDSRTGAKSLVQGTGFVISARGHVLTASHLFRAWRAQTEIAKKNNPIYGSRRNKPGYVVEPPLILHIMDPGNPDAEDVALLKLPNLTPSTAYKTAPICFRSAAAAKTGDEIIGYGFPLESLFQPVRGTLGTRNAEGDRWAAEAAFTHGMSGGPVYSKAGVVIGIIKGGLENFNAVRQITPIDHAKAYLSNADFLEQCPDPDCVTVTLGDGGSTCIKPGSRKSFRDCADCPEMVLVPEGRFQMGSPENEKGRARDEGPMHAVSIAAPFAMGQYEITVGQYLRCVSEDGCPRPEWWEEDSNTGTGSFDHYKDLGPALTGEDFPIVGVNWSDAEAYAAWLSRKTGQTYRLPSEAEWEYAARARATGLFSLEGPVSTAKANYYDRSAGGENRGRPLAVSSFQPNDWGLYQVHGNVWEWTRDCWNTDYEGAPTDGSAWTFGDCDRRVLRGGSWNSDPNSLRSAARLGYPPPGNSSRTNTVGFRLSRTLNP